MVAYNQAGRKKGARRVDTTRQDGYPTGKAASQIQTSLTEGEIPKVEHAICPHCMMTIKILALEEYEEFPKDKNERLQ
jgi:hypothetical protein